MSGPFDLQVLLAEARARTGLSDFGDENFLQPLGIISRSLETEAPLSEAGRAAQRERLIGSLSDRLTLHEWLRRHPEIREERIDAPVVIAGLPRTGTTMLYRMLAAAKGIAAPRFYEVTALCPAFDWDFESVRDPRLATARERVSAMNAAMPELASIYPFEAEAPEESIFLYSASFLSTSEQSNALVPTFNDWFASADKRPAYRYLKLALQFLQWQRRRECRWRNERWLLKTPDHLHGLEELLDIFPDARIIQTHRDPVETIPSICSFIRVLHKPTVARDDARDIGAAWSAMFARSMGQVADVRTQHPERFVDIWYRDTVADPRRVAEQVFGFIGEPLTEEGWAEMQRWRDANQREARPAHRYDLAEFGLSEEDIKVQFATYRSTYIASGAVAATQTAPC